MIKKFWKAVTLFVLLVPVANAEYLGMFKRGETVPVIFNTYNTSNASITITGLAVTDIEIYKAGSITQRASDSGYALIDTDGIDIDGVTGQHGFTIDTGDNTTAGFWTAGAYYTVELNSITVDTQTVVGRWSFQLDPYVTDYGTAQSGTASTIVLKSASAFADDIPNNQEICVIDGTGEDQCRVISDYTNSTDTVTVAQNWATNPSSDSVYYLKKANQSTVSEVGSVVAADVVAAWLAEACPGSPTTNSLADRLCSDVAGILEDTGTTLANVLGAPSISIADDIATAISQSPQMVSTTIATLTSQTSFTLTAGSTDNDVYNDAIMVITDQATTAQKAIGEVSDYVGSTKTIALESDPGIFTIAVGDTVQIFAPQSVIRLADNLITANKFAADSITQSAIASNAIGPAELGPDSIGASELSAAAVDEIWDEVVETAGATYTGRCLLAVLGAYAAGTVTTVGNTSTYRETSGGSTRIVGTVTASGRDTMTITCP